MTVVSGKKSKRPMCSSTSCTRCGRMYTVYTQHHCMCLQIRPGVLVEVETFGDSHAMRFDGCFKHALVIAGPHRRPVTWSTWHLNNDNEDMLTLLLESGTIVYSWLSECNFIA